MADTGGVSDYSILNQTRKEGTDQQGGWATLGSALGGRLGGPNSAAGQMAYARGQQIASSTVDALAQADQRRTENAGREAAATAIEQHGNDMGLNPTIIPYLAASVRAGTASPDIIAKATLDFHKNSGLNMIEQGGQEAGVPKAIIGAGINDPAAVMPKAEGPNQSFISPFTPSAPATGPGAAGVGAYDPTHLGAEQHSLNQGLTNQRESAAAKNDRAPAGGAASGKLQTGFMWDIDPNTGQVNTNPDGTWKQVPNPDAGEGAVSHRYHEVSSTAYSNLAGELHNVSKMGYNTDTGYTQFGDAKAGLLHTVNKNLGLALSDTDQQQYRTTTANIGRFLSSIENAGRMPPGTLVGQLDDAIKNNPGNTEGSRLYNIAVARQLAETGAVAFAATNAATALKHNVQGAMADVRSAVPFLPDDVIDFERKGKGMTFEEYLKAHPSAGFRGQSSIIATHAGQTAPPPAAPPAGAPAQPAAAGGLPTLDEINAEIARRAHAGTPGVQ